MEKGELYQEDVIKMLKKYAEITYVQDYDFNHKIDFIIQRFKIVDKYINIGVQLTTYVNEISKMLKFYNIRNERTITDRTIYIQVDRLNTSLEKWVVKAIYMASMEIAFNAKYKNYDLFLINILENFSYEIHNFEIYLQEKTDDYFEKKTKEELIVDNCTNKPNQNSQFEFLDEIKTISKKAKKKVKDLENTELLKGYIYHFRKDKNYGFLYAYENNDLESIPKIYYFHFMNVYDKPLKKFLMNLQKADCDEKGQLLNFPEVYFCLGDSPVKKDKKQAFILTSNVKVKNTD
jgi:hypothetical protein